MRFDAKLENRSKIASQSLSNKASCEKRAQDASWGVPESILQGSGTLLGRSWSLLGRSGAPLGRSWVSFGCLWAALGRLFVAHGSWVRLGAPRLEFKGFRMPPDAILSKSGNSFNVDFWIPCVYCCTKSSMTFTYAFRSPPAARRYVRSAWNGAKLAILASENCGVCPFFPS